jgi:aspartate aminotransferase-like enzyme
MKKTYNLLAGPTEIFLKFKDKLFQTPVSQRSSTFLKSWYNIKTNLKILLDNVDGDVAIITASASGAMEATILSCCDEYSKVLVISCGKFGDRFFELTKIHKINAHYLSFIEDRLVDYSIVEKTLKNGNFTHICYQICETSSGIYCDPQIIKNLAIKYSCITIADAVSAFLSEIIYQDEMSIDFLILGSQKGFNAPAGVSFVSINKRGLELINNNNTKSLYFNLKYYLMDPPFTPAINTIFFIEKFLIYVKKIGYKNIIKRNENYAIKTREFLKRYKIKLYAKDPSSAVSVFEYDKSNELIEFAKDKYNLLLSAGQGKLKGKVFRVGHLGLTERRSYDILFIALKKFFQQYETSQL